MRSFLGLIIALLCLAPFPVAAREITVATWNLGWHVDKALAVKWISACDGLFAKNAAGVWAPTTSDAGVPGWTVNFREKVEWDLTKFPVCDIYKDRAAKTVPVTVAAYNKRLQQLRQFFDGKMPADIYAFQEVSGEQAVRDALPNGGAGYTICSFTDFKVQRLAIAWKTSLGEQLACTVESSLRLPANPADDQPRPGLSVDLSIDGKVVRVLAVHLKSSCVSPLEDRGDLAGTGRDCTILQQQVVPLEHWVETRSVGADGVIMLGDFNRNLWHEQSDTGPARTDGSPPQGALPAGVLVKHLFAEVFDGAPAETSFTLLPEVCPVNALTATLCQKGEAVLLSPDERRQLSQGQNLGCRNPIGLDHILIGGGFAAAGPAEHVAIGILGDTKPADATHTDPLLAVSDHCPMSAKLKL